MSKERKKGNGLYVASVVFIIGIFVLLNFTKITIGQTVFVGVVWLVVSIFTGIWWDVPDHRNYNHRGT